MSGTDFFQLHVNEQKPPPAPRSFQWGFLPEPIRRERLVLSFLYGFLTPRPWQVRHQIPQSQSKSRDAMIFVNTFYS
jgi:hypothetical protein